MTAEHDHQIAELEQQLEAQRDVLENLAAAWRAAVVPFLGEQYESHAQRAVEAAPERAMELAASSELSALKREIQELVSRTPASAEEQLSRPQLWAHRTEAAPSGAGARSRYSYTGNRAPEVLDEQVRLLIGLVAEPLMSRGLGRTGADGDWRLEGDRYRYPYALDWSPAMRSTLAEYGKAHTVFDDVLQRLRKVRLDKARTEARDLWDRS